MNIPPDIFQDTVVVRTLFPPDFVWNHDVISAAHGGIDIMDLPGEVWREGRHHHRGTLRGHRELK